MEEMPDLDKKMRHIFETAQKMKDGTMKPAVVYNSIEDFAARKRAK